jgi:butyrate kinase
MAQKLILAINPGNTSTTVAVYDGLTPVCVESIKHPDEELSRFSNINAQKEFREELVYDFLHNKAIDPGSIRAIAARGGLLKPLASGTYIVDQRMVDDLVEAKKGSHASNLAAQIGFSMAANLGITCYIVDPVSVDEACWSSTWGRGIPCPCTRTGAWSTRSTRRKKAPFRWIAAAACRSCRWRAISAKTA